MSTYNVNRVKCDLHKNRPVAYVESCATLSVEEIAKTVFSEWKLHDSSLIVNVISDASATFHDFGVETRRRQIDRLKSGFRKLFEADVQLILFTSGRSDDTVAVAAGRAFAEFLENANYANRFNVGFDEQIEDETTDRSCRTTATNFKLIGVNKRFGRQAASGREIEDFSYLDENHSHLILIDDVNSTDFDLLKVRMQLLKHLSTFVEENRSQGVDRDDERYVSLPVNFYEVPRSRLKSTLPFAANVYFGFSNDNYDWLQYSFDSEIAVLCFENASSYANFLSFASRCCKSSLLEKRFNETFQNISLQYSQIRQNVEKFMAYCSNVNTNMFSCFDILKDESNLENLSLFAAKSWIRCNKEKTDSRSLVRFLIQMNTPCLLNDIKLEPTFVDSCYFYEYFEEVLVNPSMECFVEWFLIGGIRIDRFLTSERLIRLFKTAQPRDFFNNVVLGSLLGYVSFPNDVTKFIKVDLKRLFYHLCSKMIKFDDITFDVDALKSSLSRDASLLLEKHCTDILIYWSAIMKRNSLSRLLWSYAYDPLPLALVLAEVFKNLHSAAFEFFVYAEDLSTLARCFRDFSVDLLDEADARGAHRRSYDILCYGFEQYSNVTATHLAYLSENRRFIAHIWCQRWLNRLLYGNLKICKLAPGFLTAPAWFKIVAGAVFVFPIKLWIKCPPPASRKFNANRSITNVNNAVVANGNNEIDATSDNNVRFRSLTEEVMVRVGIVDEERGGAEQQHHGVPNGDSNETDEFLPSNNGQRIIGVDLANSNQPPRIVEKTVPDSCCTVKTVKSATHEASFCATIYQFYNAPVTKYWLHLIFRLFYLILFGLALSVPKCGNTALDLLVWVWSFIDFLESLWVLYLKRKNGHNRAACRSYFAVFDVFVVATFLCLFILFKIVSNQTYFSSSSFTGRTVAALFLLYKCYSTLLTYLPMHSTLGPFLIRIRLMICRDFVNFLILISLLVASFAVVIHAIIYPDYPAESGLWAKAFKRAWFTLFVTPIDDLNEESVRCKHLTLKNPPYCNSGAYSDPACPTVTPMAYIVVIQYLILIKLIAWPILFALFGKTAKEIDDEADCIWKYQFYCTVIDFSLKPALPPPLTPLAFVFLCCAGCSRLGLGCFQRNLEPAVDHPDVGLVQFGTVLTVEDDRQRPNSVYYNFWRSLARCLYEKRKIDGGASAKSKSSNKDMADLHNEIAALKNQLAKLNEELQSHA